MKFKRFEELFHMKYPNGTVHQHGTFGGTEKSMKVAIEFTPYSKVKTFYGSYQDVLKKIGIDVVYKEDIDRAKAKLERLKDEDGQVSFFDEVIDNSELIAEVEKYLQTVSSYIIV